MNSVHSYSVSIHFLMTIYLRAISLHFLWFIADDEWSDRILEANGFKTEKKVKQNQEKSEKCDCQNQN